METIKKIEEVENVKLKEEAYSSYNGYRVTTDKQEILFVIDNCQDCCEHWGYLMSEDNISEFIGSKLVNITLTDTMLATVDYNDKYIDAGGTMFVNIETTAGTLQLVAYNEHNGYYGHGVVLSSNQLKEEVWL